MNYSVNYLIPVRNAEWFKAVVLGHWFKNDDPIITRHKDNGRMSVWTFESKTEDAIGWISAVAVDLGGHRFLK